MPDLTPDPEQESVAANTDRELWREGDGGGNGMSYYADSIHVTEQGLIGIDCGGAVYVLPVREWHGLAAERERHEREIHEIVSALPGLPHGRPTVEYARALNAEREGLREALVWAKSSLQTVIAGKPHRAVAELFAAIDAALGVPDD